MGTYCLTGVWGVSARHALKICRRHFFGSVWKDLCSTKLNFSQVLTRNHIGLLWIWSLPWSHFLIWTLYFILFLLFGETGNKTWSYFRTLQALDPLYFLQISLENQAIPFCISSVYSSNLLYVVTRAYTSSMLPPNLRQIHQLMRYIFYFQYYHN